MNKKQYQYSNLFAWGLVLFLISNYIFGWTYPSESPPGGNIVLDTGKNEIRPAGSTGYIQFYDADDLGADSNLFWDIVNKRLGIGATAPGAALEVTGSIILNSTNLESGIEICRNGICCPIWKDCDGDGITFGGGDCDESSPFAYLGSLYRSSEYTGIDYNCDGEISYKAVEVLETMRCPSDNTYICPRPETVSCQVLCQEKYGPVVIANTGRLGNCSAVAASDGQCRGWGKNWKTGSGTWACNEYCKCEIRAGWS
ncbi:MAG: hypothetical protein GX941_07220 [Candidatus Methanofastidiosa archaeon]|nr:hypothetical protein [Candidatus Methanofastidiosa archaeon]